MKLIKYARPLSIIMGELLFNEKTILFFEWQANVNRDGINDNEIDFFNYVFSKKQINITNRLIKKGYKTQ